LRFFIRFIRFMAIVYESFVGPNGEMAQSQ
jgi:hypothetical protein